MSGCQLIIPIFCRIWDSSKFESFFPFKAGTASAAMSLPTFVATPGISIGYLQGRTKLDNLMLAKMHERGFKSQVWISKSFGSKPLHGIKCSNEFRATIRINKVVASMDTHGDNLSLLSNSNRV